MMPSLTTHSTTAKWPPSSETMPGQLRVATELLRDPLPPRLVRHQPKKTLSKMLRRKLSREEEAHAEQEAADEEVVLHDKMKVIRGRAGRRSTIALTQEGIHVCA